MFYGTYDHSIDAKGRLFIPVKLVSNLGEAFILTKTVTGCISIYTMDEWNKYVEKLDMLPNSKYGNMKRMIFSKTQTASLDAQGRVLIPQSLREELSLSGDVKIIGNNNCIEIWNKDVWTKLLKETEETVTDDFLSEVDL